MKLFKNILLAIGKRSKESRRPALLLRLSAILIGFVVLILLAQLWNSTQPIKSVTISGTTVLSAAEVKEDIDDTAIINIPKNKIRYDVIANRLRTNPYIADTYMHEGIQSLNIEIVERSPIAIIANNYGDLKYISADGIILPYRLFRSAVDLPIITGVYNGEKLDSTALNYCVNIIQELKNPKYGSLNKLISEVNFQHNGRTINLFTSDTATKIKIGNVNNISDKLQTISMFFNYKLTNSAAFSYIDARWSNHIVAKTK